VFLVETAVLLSLVLLMASINHKHQQAHSGTASSTVLVWSPSHTSQEIRDCYPPWLERNEGKIAPDDLQRYTKQYGFIQQICQLYDEHPDNYSDLVGLMQQVRVCGCHDCSVPVAYTALWFRGGGQSSPAPHPAIRQMPVMDGTHFPAPACYVSMLS
jgi:hypothetical protein